ncbi:aldehyde dehydrogenase family protein [Pseudomonas putida]|uniref:aldehyde dehydrogenase family protein n=1 Tax=Pseudomonas putida TaxID=303 RepID=UPI00031D854C
METLLPNKLWNERLFTGAWVPGEMPATTVTSPGNGQPLGTLANVGAEQVERSAREAAKAQRNWYTLPYEERASVLRKAAAIAEQYQAEIADWIVRESGSTQAKAAFESSITIKSLHEACALPSRSQGEVLPSTAGRLSIARRRPLGVIGVISPFNFPLYLAMRAVAPALATGNAVVLKPDPRTAVCGGLVIARIFELAGLPAGVLHVLPGGAEAGAALTASPSVAMIQFTGSTARMALSPMM